MSKFIMFGKYSTEALKGISAERTDKAIKIINKNKGKVISMYAVMGKYDLIFTLDYPNAEKAMKASVELNKLTGISFSTSPAVEIEEFDKLVSKTK